MLSHPNVILITVDTLRADRVGCHSPRESLTPNIDALAAEGTTFSNTIAQVPLTLASHTTILTGTYPMSHGVQDLSTVRPPAFPVGLNRSVLVSRFKTAAGSTETDFLTERMGLSDEQAESVKAQERSRIPLGRHRLPEEVATWIVTLASDARAND